MLKLSIIKFLLAAVVFTASIPALAQTEKGNTAPENEAELLVKANKAFVAQDYLAFREVLERLHQKRPYNGQYMYQLVIAHALLKEKSQAYEMMLKMQQQGLAYDFTASDSTMNIRGTEIFDYIDNLMKLAAEPMGESEEFIVLPDKVLMPETISWDESRQKFLVGTVSDGSVFAVGEDGQVTELLKANKENGLWAIFDIKVDAAKNRLWISSASVPLFSGFDPADKGRSALFEFDLESLDLIRRYPVPVDGYPHILGSMVLSPNGDIYLADRSLPLIYRKTAGESKLTAVIALREMASLRGITIQADGRLIYVADREMGIMVIDIDQKKAGMLGVPETLNVGGIDGLYLKGNSLFMIQNGNKPQRVMRLQLDSSGTRVESVRPMAVAQPDFDYPSFGSIKGENLYYYASSHLSRKSGSQEAVTVLKTPLDSGQDLVQPDMQHFLQQQRKKAQEQAAEKEEK